MALDEAGVVLDSNILLAALNVSEPFHNQTVQILKSIVSEDIHIYVPPAFVLEIEDILIKNLNLGRMSRVVYADSVKKFDHLLNSGFFEVADTKFIHPTLYRTARQLAHLYRLRFYDATYLALAQNLSVSLITFDQKLHMAAGQAKLLSEKWKTYAR